MSIMQLKYVKLKSCPPPPKHRRKNVSLQLKLDILRRLEAGELTTAVAKSLQMPYSTVRSILLKREHIRKNLPSVVGLRAVKHRRTKYPLLEVTEAALVEWMADKGSDELRPGTVQKKAREIYKKLKAGDSEVPDFTASRGWYRKFRERLRKATVNLPGV